MTDLCKLANEWPVGTRVEFVRQGGTVITAQERYDDPDNDMAPKMGDRVGSAYRNKNGLTYIAVRMDDGKTRGCGAESLMRLPEAATQTLFTQADVDRAVQNAKATAYAEGLRAGKLQAARQMSAFVERIEETAR